MTFAALLISIAIRILPLYTQGQTVHIWNPTSSMQLVVFQDNKGNDVEMAIVPPTKEITVQSQADWLIQYNPSVQLWTEASGAIMGAVEPKVEWRVAVRQQWGLTPTFESYIAEKTGIAIVNPSDQQIHLDFEFESATDYKRMDAAMAPKSRLAMFVSDLLRTNEDGTLVVRSSDPIVVAAARCNQSGCTASPVN